MSVSSLIKTAFMLGADSANKAADDAIEANITKAVQSRFGDVTPTLRAINQVRKNVEDFGLNPATATEDELFRGITGASEYKGNILTQAFNTDASGFFAGAGSMAMGAAVGAGAAAATGGDYREGAAMGAVAGVGIAGLGRSIMKSIGSVEDNFMNSLLKDVDIKPREGMGSLAKVGDDLDKSFMDVTYTDMIDAGYGKISPAQMLGMTDDGIKNSFQRSGIEQTTEKFNAYHYSMNKPLDEIPYPDKAILGDDLNYVSPMDAQAGVDIPYRLERGLSEMTRKEKIDAVSDLTPKGSVAKYKQDVLMGRKDLNVAQATRMSGFIGTALTGMAFSSRRRDHRRGFNKRRGNRV